MGWIIADASRIDVSVTIYRRGCQQAQIGPTSMEDHAQGLKGTSQESGTGIDHRIAGVQGNPFRNPLQDNPPFKANKTIRGLKAFGQQGGHDWPLGSHHKNLVVLDQSGRRNDHLFDGSTRIHYEVIKFCFLFSAKNFKIFGCLTSKQNAR